MRQGIGPMEVVMQQGIHMKGRGMRLRGLPEIVALDHDLCQVRLATQVLRQVPRQEVVLYAEYLQAVPGISQF